MSIKITPLDIKWVLLHTHPKEWIGIPNSRIPYWMQENHEIDPVGKELYKKKKHKKKHKKKS